MMFHFAFYGKAYLFKYNFCFLPFCFLSEAVVDVPAQHAISSPRGLGLTVADYLCFPQS